MNHVQPHPKPVRALHWRAPDLADAELLRGRYRGHVYPAHMHRRVSVSLITGGAIEVEAGDHQFVARKGSIVVINAGVVHAGRPVDDGGWKMRSIHVDENTFRTHAALDHEARIHLRGPHIRDNELADIIFRLHWCSEVKGPDGPRAKLFSQLLHVLLDPSQTAPAGPSGPLRDAAQVAQAQCILRENLESNISLHSLSRITCVPRFRLLRSFSRLTGLTPHAWQIQVRAHAAADLLRQGHRPAAVAAECGFSDQAHLTRIFRRIYGITPGAYRSS